ncbi:hypothetical protein PF003_g18422 [Phytophthora fragariae]|nr:hypothetical protein PF003_g18422 [Phytophthora fragariae]
MQLIDNLRSAVLQQREDEVSNFFSDVSDLREFISAREPGAGVNITVKMCCYNAERLSADNGSRITLVNSSAHGTFEEVQEALNELNSVNRKPFIAQVTVWDSKKKFGSPKSGPHPIPCRRLCTSSNKYTAVGYFSDIAKAVCSSKRLPRIGSLRDSSDSEAQENAGEPSGRHPKARALLPTRRKRGAEGWVAAWRLLLLRLRLAKRNTVASRG